MFWVLAYCYKQHRRERGRKKPSRLQPTPESYARREVHDELFPQQRFQLRLQNLSYHPGTLSLVTSKSAESWHGKDPAILPRVAGRASCLGRACMLRPSLPALSEFTDRRAARVHGWLWLGSLGVSMGSTPRATWLMLVSGLVLKCKHMFLSHLSLSPPFFPNLSFITWQENSSHQTQARARPNIHGQHASINTSLVINWDKLRYNTGQSTSLNALF